MGTKLPASVAATNQQGDEQGIEAASLEKYAWQEDRSLQFHKTLDILRYTVTGANPASGIMGSRTLVADLDDLPCWFDDYTLDYANKFGGEVDEADRVFVIYDNNVLINDVISFDGDVYEPFRVIYDEESGRCEVHGKIGGKA